MRGHEAHEGFLQRGEKPSRVRWIDYARGVGIIFVVIGHVWRGLHNAGILTNERYFQVLDRSIYIFHMPLFFLLSGMVFESTVTRYGWQASLLRRAGLLLLPLLFWSWAYGLFRNLAGDLSNHGALNWWEVLLFPFPPKDIFWFLWSLFVIQTFVALIVTARSWTAKQYVAITAVTLLLACLASTLPLHETVAKPIQFLPYFLTGLILARIIPIGLGSVRCALIGIAIFVLSELVANFLSLDPDGVLGIVVGMGASIGALSLLSWLGSGAGRLSISAQQLGKASMAVYLCHVLVLAVVRLVLLRFHVQDVLVHLVVGLVCGVMMPFAFWLVSMRLRFDWIFGYRTRIGVAREATPG